MDFYKIKENSLSKDKRVIYPDFVVGRTKDLMIRGGKFYAVWNEDTGLWSTDEYDVAYIVDKDVRTYYDDYIQKHPFEIVQAKYMVDWSSGSWDQFKKFVSKAPDNSHQLDNVVTFSNTEVKKSDYISKRLDYPLEAGECLAYDEIIGTLYSEEERAKIEWAIGSIIAGDAKKIQKFLVLYGDAGAGKSTILNIIQMLFKGYYTTFDAKELTSSNNGFATDSFSTDPLVAIQHDGDLSGIKDNSILNSIISHEDIIVNEKFKARYTTKAQCFLFMATNKPVKITDSKSGLIRRLIDVKPSGNKIPQTRYNQLMQQVEFELGHIAYHCLDVYKKMGKHYYSSYRPLDMMFKTDPFFNFVEDSYLIFKEQNGCSLKQAYAMYKQYCEESGSEYKLQMYKFREELKNYFKEYISEGRVDGVHVRNYYNIFLTDKFVNNKKNDSPEKVESNNLYFGEYESIFDKIAESYPAQYAVVDGKVERPLSKWINCKTILKDIDTSKLHYVKVPENHIVIDFDLKDSEGNKSYERNIEAASKWPKTYAELSKSGCGIHLHYIYNGDPLELSRIYDEDIEIKVFTGDSSLRRKLTKCNDIPIATISSGLPIKKKVSKAVNFEASKSEKGIRALIIKALRKEVHTNTKSNVDFIYYILEEAYNNGICYDVTDMRPAILAFAANSTHQSELCIKLVNDMKFASEDHSVDISEKSDDDSDIVFYDIEVFPNLLLINWKKRGPGNKVVRMINPSPAEVEEFLRFKLVGFNCRRYDNHIVYARMMGYTNEELFRLSQRIIEQSKNCFFGEAYNVSYTDIYDFASAGNKKSLKKLEIEMGIHHLELGMKWDEPVPEEKWEEVAQYCDNDVIATEAAFDYLSGDWTARCILADLAGMSRNDTTNTLTTRFIFGNERHPQGEFNYRNLADPVFELDHDDKEFLEETFPEMMAEPHGEAKSLLPYFEGYVFENGKSYYKGFEIGEGGRVWAKPGMYGRAKTFDVTSQHPHSIMAEVLFGARFTRAFKDIVYGRVHIKHKSWDIVNEMLDGKLKPYVQKVIDGEMTAKDLANALKTAINSVYGLTSAKFENAFRDPRNIDNIVAKRGALFMTDLMDEVTKRGGEVIHIKTDSIKILDPTPEIEEFVFNFGKRYGYSFEVEHVFEKICLVNDAVYIAKLADDDPEEPGEWTATGTQFAVPYVFKTLFSKDKIEFEDMCETKSATTSLYLDLNENLPDVTYEEQLKTLRKRKIDSNLEPMTHKDKNMLEVNNHISDEELNMIINSGHNYKFVGKVGQFSPVIDGVGGGLLMRENGDSYAAAGGTKGFRWMESETVRHLDYDNIINKDYYKKMVDTAIDSIAKFGDVEWFLGDEDSVEPFK